MKDIQLEGETYNRQGLLLIKLSSIKIEPKNNLKKNSNSKRNVGRSRDRDKTPNNFRTKMKNNNDNVNEKKTIRSITTNIVINRRNRQTKGIEKKGK